VNDSKSQHQILIKANFATLLLTFSI